MSLVALEALRVQFPVGRRTLTAVDGISLHIDPGETLALVGESGSGKSTIGNVVAGLQTPTAGGMRFRGQPMDAANTRAARKAIQMVFQDPFGALDPRMPVSAIIAEPLLIQRIGDRRDREDRAAALLGQVGLPPDALNRYPHEFSGGQRQRIAIARALAPNPALIVADEPLSALDVSIQSQVLNVLADLRRDRGLAYLFISHDLAVVNHLADRVAVLYLGRLVEVAPRADVFATPSHPYTTALLEAMPRIGRRHRRAVAIAGEMPSPLDPPPGCVFHTRCPKAQAICRTDPPMLEPAPGRPAQLAACHFKA
jgi:peptide/nickel transport system ATP-binding protein/oligopeptide transport system ATP-binding protein